MLKAFVPVNSSKPSTNSSSKFVRTTVSLKFSVKSLGTNVEHGKFEMSRYYILGCPIN